MKDQDHGGHLVKNEQRWGKVTRQGASLGFVEQFDFIKLRWAWDGILYLYFFWYSFGGFDDFLPLGTLRSFLPLPVSVCVSSIAQPLNQL